MVEITHRIEERDGGRIAIVHLPYGDVTARCEDDVSAFRARLNEAVTGVNGVVIDCVMTESIDSSAINVLVGVWRRGNAAIPPVRVVLAAAREHVLEVMKRTKLSEVFNIQETIEEAIEVATPK